MFQWQNVPRVTKSQPSGSREVLTWGQGRPLFPAQVCRSLLWGPILADPVSLETGNV